MSSSITEAFVFELWENRDRFNLGNNSRDEFFYPMMISEAFVFEL